MRGPVALAVAALVASCGFATRSGEFECDSGGGCPDGRTCVSGWCVAAAAAPDAAYVPTIECETGEPCVVDCDDPGDCAGGIDCSGASACDITCSGESSCAGPIECGSGPCSIDCTGDDSCGGSIDCNDACACDLGCGGPGSCASEVDCPHTGQCKDGKECTSGGAPTCNQC